MWFSFFVTEKGVHLNHMNLTAYVPEMHNTWFLEVVQQFNAH